MHSDDENVESLITVSITLSVRYVENMAKPGFLKKFVYYCKLSYTYVFFRTSL